MKLSFTTAELSRFNKRTYQLYSNLTARFHKTIERLGLCGGKLDLSLGFLRLEAQKAIGESCLYCGDRITIKTISLDHKIPISRAWEWPELFRNSDPFSKPALVAFDWFNCRFCCLTCNKRKGDLTDLEFSALLEAIEDFPPAAKRYIRAKLSARLPFHKTAKGAAA